MNDSRPPKIKLRWYQFSLRTLLVFVLVAGMGFGWLGTKLQRARKNRLAVAEVHKVEADIRKAGGAVQIQIEHQQSPSWLERLLRDPGVFDVVKVRMGRATDAALKHLKGLEGMTRSWELDLSRSGVTDAGLEHLKEFTSLRVLRLVGTAVTPVGVSNLQEALPSARITPSPRQLAAIAEIKKAGGHVHFNRHDNCNWLSVSFLDPRNVTDAVLVQIKELADLREWTIGLQIPGSQVTDARLEHLKGLRSLKTLKLDNTQVSDAGLKHLEGLRNLTTLGLGHTQVTDAGLLHLKGLTKLRGLYINHTQVTDAGLEHLKALTNLKMLWLGRTQLTDGGMEHLKALANLESLDISFTQITDAGLKHLEGLTSLDGLFLSNTQITDAGLVHLKGLTKLRWLNINNTQVTDAGLEHLKGLTSLIILNLNNPQVTDAAVENLQQALPKCRIWR